MEFEPQYFNRLVRARRSVFPDQFQKGKTIPDPIVTQIIENATWAPNHGRMEPWQFKVFTGAGLQRLADFQSNMYRDSAGENFNEAKFMKLRQQPLKASHIIAICMKRTLTKNIPEVEDIAAVACAVQNIYLSVTAYGLGGYWTTGGVTYNEKAKPFFELGEADRLMGFFYMAYVDMPSVGATRARVEEKVQWIRD